MDKCDHKDAVDKQYELSSSESAGSSNELLNSDILLTLFLIEYYNEKFTINHLAYLALT